MKYYHHLLLFLVSSIKEFSDSVIPVTFQYMCSFCFLTKSFSSHSGGKLRGTSPERSDCPRPRHPPPFPTFETLSVPPFNPPEKSEREERNVPDQSPPPRPPPPPRLLSLEDQNKRRSVFRGFTGNRSPPPRSTAAKTLSPT